MMLKSRFLILKPFLLNLQSNLRCQVTLVPNLKLPTWWLNLNIPTAPKLKAHFQNPFLRKIPTDSSFFQSNTMTSGKCTKTKWPVFGQQKKSIWLKTLKTGRDSTITRDTSLSMFLPSSLLLMVLFLRIWLRDL